MRNGRSTPKVPENVLKEMGYGRYNAYLDSPHWRDLRNRLRRERPALWRCEVCESTERLNVHHRTYRRFGRERLGDFVVLCQPHHRALHDAFWRADTKWTLWDFGRDWIDNERRQFGLLPLHARVTCGT